MRSIFAYSPFKISFRTKKRTLLFMVSEALSQRRRRNSKKGARRIVSKTETFLQTKLPCYKPISTREMEATHMRFPPKVINPLMFPRIDIHPQTSQQFPKPTERPG